MGKFEDLTAALKAKEHAEIEAKNQLAEKARNEKQSELAKVNDFFSASVAPAINDIKTDLLSKGYSFEQLNIVGGLFSKEYKITLAKIPIEMALQHSKAGLVFALHSPSLSYKIKRTFSLSITDEIADESSFREHVKGLISDAVESIVTNAA